MASDRMFQIEVLAIALLGDNAADLLTLIREEIEETTTASYRHGARDMQRLLSEKVDATNIEEELG